MFTKAGPVSLILGRVEFAEPKFDEAKKYDNAFDICIECTNADDPAQVDWWHGEMSPRYGTGNWANVMQSYSTMKTLRNLGFEGDDLTTLEDQIKGKKAPGMIKEVAGKGTNAGKTFFNIQYIGGGVGNAPAAADILSADQVKARLAALVGGKGQGPSQGTSPTGSPATASATPPSAAPAGNPFAKGTATATARPNPFAKKTAG